MSSGWQAALVRAIIMGPPGSGKGTISSRIVTNFGLPHLSSGDLLRSQIAKDTAAGKEVKVFIEKGKLVPDALMNKLIIGEIKSSLNHSSWLLDGYPRTLAQAETLSDAFQLNCVINLDVPHEVIVERIKGRWTHLPSGRIYHTEFNPPRVPGKDDVTGELLVQRGDDKPETVQLRLKTYEQQTKDVIDYYRKKNLLKEFHGTESNKIWPHVQKYLQDMLSNINQKPNV